VFWKVKVFVSGMFKTTAFVEFVLVVSGNTARYIYVPEYLLPKHSVLVDQGFNFKIIRVRHSLGMK
jgi:hypothetical protein